MAEQGDIIEYVPMSVYGTVAVVPVPVDKGIKDFERRQDESVRVAQVARRRLYTAGKQYDTENVIAAQAAGTDPISGRLPEHLRKHAYSVQVQECIDFIADRIGKGFSIEAADASVQRVIDDMVQATDTISAQDDSGDPVVVTDDPLREALGAGDVAVHVRWDPVQQTVFLDFWESENVEFYGETTRRVDEVVRTALVWRADPAGAGQVRQVAERHVYDVVPNDRGVMEARVRVFWDAEDTPKSTEFLGMPVIPWVLLRADMKNLRKRRGDSLVTTQVMGSADRYNAVEQLSYLIARYNSHGNVVVVGDGASLKLEAEERVSKDVADVLTFPGGTQVIGLTLPTDAQMIEHQRAVLADSIYGAFGLTRVDQDTLGGLGGVSGYALEILNQKSEGTFGRITRHWRKDWLALLNMVLDVHAWKVDVGLGTQTVGGEFVPAEQVDDEDVVALTEMGTAWESVDPAVVFPNRKIVIRMGNGYIVDDVMVRDDFTAGLYSRAEALRQRGYDSADIDAIQSEIDDEQPATEAAGLPPAPTGRLAAVGAAPPVGTKAGSTVGTATRGA
jgi:hypothetical protein